jgi:hypothetical protein
MKINNQTDWQKFKKSLAEEMSKPAKPYLMISSPKMFELLNRELELRSGLTPPIINTGIVYETPKTYCVGCGQKHDLFAFNACWDCIDQNKVKWVWKEETKDGVTVKYRSFVKQ